MKLERASKEEMKEEALERLNLLKINRNVIKEFKEENILNKSEGILGSLYWLDEKDKIDINPKIRDLVTDCLTQVSKNGIDEVYTKENFKKLYKKYCS